MQDIRVKGLGQFLNNYSQGKGYEEEGGEREGGGGEEDQGDGG